MWVGEVRWEALGNGGLHGGAAGGGTKHRWASKEEGFSDCGATCIKEECHTIKTQNTQQSTLHTHTLLIRSQGNMPGGVAAKHVMKHSNFTMKYPCVLPQTCRGARDVCAVAHAHSHFFLSFLHTQMYWKSQPSLQIWHIAEDIHRVCHTRACTHTYTWPFDFRVTLKEPFWFFSEISLSCLWCLITLYSKLLQEWKILDFQPLLEPVIHLSQRAWRCEKRDCAK